MPPTMQFQWANDFAKQHGPAAQDEEDHGWSSRFNALGFPVSDRQLCELGWNDRMKAHEWVQTRAAADAGVEHQHTAPLAYFETMAQYRFVICPFGSGIQSNKFFEALLVLTVPIVRRIGPVSLYDDLISYGFPVLVVDDWANITAERVNDYWKSVAPALPRIRQRCLTVDGFWRIFTGANHSCL
eukprot:UN2120